MGVAVTNHPASIQADASLGDCRDEDRSRVQAYHRDEGCKTERGHERYRRIRYSAKERKMRTQMPHKQSREQRAHSCSGRSACRRCGNCDENAGKAAEKYRKPKDEKSVVVVAATMTPISLAVRANCFRPHKAHDVATLDGDARSKGDIVFPARDSTQIEATRPALAWPNPLRFAWRFQADVSRTSATDTGMSRSARSQPLSARGPSTLISASRAPDTATISPGLTRTSGDGSRIAPSRRRR